LAYIVFGLGLVSLPADISSTGRIDYGGRGASSKGDLAAALPKLPTEE
jgi:hypothetical protein